MALNLSFLLRIPRLGNGFLWNYHPLRCLFRAVTPMAEELSLEKLRASPGILLLLHGLRRYPMLVPVFFTSLCFFPFPMILRFLFLTFSFFCHFIICFPSLDFLYKFICLIRFSVFHFIGFWMGNLAVSCCLWSGLLWTELVTVSLCLLILD